MKFVLFFFLYPLNLFKSVNKSDLEIYLIFQKIAGISLVTAIILETVMGLLFIYPNTVSFYKDFNYPLPLTLQNYPLIALIILFFYFSVRNLYL